MGVGELKLHNDPCLWDFTILAFIENWQSN